MQARIVLAREHFIRARFQRLESPRKIALVRSANRIQCTNRPGIAQCANALRVAGWGYPIHVHSMKQSVVLLLYFPAISILKFGEL